MAGLKVKIGADTTALGAGMRRARGMVGGFGGAIKSMGVGRLLGGFAAMAAGAVGVGASIRGLKGALDLGGSLSDLSVRTGMAVGDLVLLQQAFRDNGISAEKLGPTINKMQKSISDAGDGMKTQTDALSKLGMSYDDLAGKSPAEQFKLIQKGMAGVQDETQRTAAAMAIFGRSGGELKVLFADGAALGNAAKTVGSQAEILEKNATSFDRSSDLLAGMGQKLTGFFVGMAEYINPILLPVLEKLNSMDLAKYGQAVGRFVALVAEAFGQGVIGQLLMDSMMIAAKGFINAIVLGFQAAVATLWAGMKNLPELFTSAFSLLTDPNLWSGVANMLTSALSGVMASFADMIGKSAAAKDLRRGSEADAIRAGNYMTMVRAGTGAGMEDSISKAMADMGRAFSETYAQDGPLTASGELNRLGETMQRLRDAVEKRTAADDAPSTPGTPPAAEAPKSKFAGRIEAPRIQSLASVGGASLTRRSVDLARERNAMLNKIERNTRGRMVAAYA